MTAALLLVAALAQAADAGGAAAPAGGVPVRLMVLAEVTSRSARVGDRFRLRVDAPAQVGPVAVPVGAMAWGEVTEVAPTAGGGKSGRLAARLLYVDLPGGPIPLTGTSASKGRENTAGVLLGTAAWGPFALFNKGTNGKLKAGEIVVGYATSAAPTP